MDNKAALIYSCLDLTSLETTDTPDTLRRLEQIARHGDREVAALCIRPHLLALARFPRLATVANFPLGTDPLERVVQDVEAAIAAGATEVDLVWPWQQSPDTSSGSVLVQKVAALCQAGNVLLKVILETAAVSLAQTRINARAAAEAGADFLKTSTGKLEPALTYDAQASTGATLEAASVLIEVARETGVGVKISGGVKTLDQAWAFYELASSQLGGSLDRRRFRIGASSLAADLIPLLDV